MSSIVVRAPAKRGFRERSRWFKLKVLTAAVYGVVVLGTIALVAMPRGGPRTLGARVTVLPGDPLMGRYFIVQNESSRDWVGVRFEIDGGYQTRRDAVIAGQKVTLYLRDFTRPETVTVKRRQKVQAVAPSSKLPVTFLRIESRGRRQTVRLEADS